MFVGIFDDTIRLNDDRYIVRDWTQYIIVIYTNNDNNNIGWMCVCVVFVYIYAFMIAIIIFEW